MIIIKLKFNLKSKSKPIPVTKRPVVNKKKRLHYIFTSIAIISFYVSIVFSFHMFYSSLENRINELREQQNSGQNINVQSSIINSFILADDILKSITDM